MPDGLVPKAPRTRHVVVEPHVPPTEWGRRVLAVREASGFSQSALAADIEVSLRVLQGWEDGSAEPNLSDAKMARFLVQEDYWIRHITTAE